MKRRAFFKFTALFTGVGAAVPTEYFTPIASALAPLRSASATPMELQRSPVAGFQYSQGEKIWDKLAHGAPLRLVREPDNPYDPRAVRVEWAGHKLGYIPRAENKAIAHLMDNRRSLEARIVNLRESSNPWERIEIAVCLNG